LISILTPFSWLYALAITARNHGFRTGFLQVRKLPVPVISVGNLTLGGSGKTPCTMSLAREARRRGLRPVILTRGYKGSARGTCLVSDEDHVMLGPAEAGDEAYLLARELPGVPVVKCPDRYDGGMHAFQRFGNDLFILDDGFQHRKLHRDVNLLLIDGPATLLRERLLPAGRLREPLSALKRADEIILTSEPAGTESLMTSLCAATPVSFMTFTPRSIRNVSGDSMPLDSLYKRKVLAFCGIANPERFRKTLKDLSVDVIEFRTFRDHHGYSDEEIQGLLQTAARVGAERVVTTEKDLVKCRTSHIWALHMKAELSEEMLERVFSRVTP